MRASKINLVIGGTGMLGDATRWLASQSDRTLLVARHASRFDIDDIRFLRLDLDWDSGAFRSGLESALNGKMPLARALLWLHNPRPILSWLMPFLPIAQTVLVLGNQDGGTEAVELAKSLITVRLGSKASASGGRRWLTDAEISDGAIRAFTVGKSQIVGDTTNKLIF